MSGDGLRIGLIGAIRRAGIAKHWDADPRAKVVAAADIYDDALAEFKETYGHNDPFCTNDYRELVARDDIDAIGVFSPDNWHAEHAIAALDAGKHTFSEKPMSIRTEDCDAMLDAWKRAGTHFMVGMNMRYMDSFLALKQIMDSGEIGDIKAVWVRHFVGMGGWYFFHDYRANHEGSTGLLLQKGSHDIDMIHFLTGRYTKRVVAMGALDYYGGDRPDDLRCEDCADKDTCTDYSERPKKTMCCFRREVDVEDHSMVLMDMGDMRATYLQCHYASHTNRNYLAIGTGGEAELSGNQITVRTQKSNKGKARSHSHFATATYDVGGVAGGHGGADPHLCKAFLDLVIDGKETVATPEAGRMTVAVGCAATQSIRNGSMPLDIPPLPESCR